MYHTAIEYYHYLLAGDGFDHVLQWYTDEHTTASFMHLNAQFNVIDRWINLNPDIGRYGRAPHFRYGWVFMRKEDAMLVKLTFG